MGLGKIINIIRGAAIVILLLHFYYYCYDAFYDWGLVSKFSDQLLINIKNTGLFNSFHESKLFALGLIALSFLGARGKKMQNLKYKNALYSFLAGVAIYFLSGFIFHMNLEIETVAIAYMALTLTGFLILMRGGALLARIIRKGLSHQPFNQSNEQFPQEERLIKNEDSLHLRGEYRYQGRNRKSYINFVNPRRGILIMGTPGSGKSYFLIESFIRQLIEKGRALFVYDHKYPELTRLTYSLFLKNRKAYPESAAFYSINFVDLSRSHRCNPIHPSTLPTMTSAMEAAKSLLLSMNRSWVNKQGDFFVESSINLLSAAIWFLRKRENGKYCSLPHVIELMHVDSQKLIAALQSDTDTHTLITPYSRVFMSGDRETFNNLMASAQIPLGRLSTPEFYYIISGHDFGLDINDSRSPKIFCLANSARDQEALAPILSLYIDRLNKSINLPGKYPSAQVCDEFATVRAASVLKTIGTGRSNQITSIVALQDWAQLKMTYSHEEAEVILNITGNIIAGQVNGETARHLSQRFARIFQPRQSVSVNSTDTSLTHSELLEASIPLSTISNLSSGHFVGLVSDNPDEPIELKAFHARIIPDPAGLSSGVKELPVVREVDAVTVNGNYRAIKEEVWVMVERVMEEVRAGG